VFFSSWEFRLATCRKVTVNGIEQNENMATAAATSSSAEKVVSSMFSASDAALDALLAKIDTHMEESAAGYSADEATSPAQRQPNYLKSTLAQTIPTNPEFIEAQRIRASFRSHSCWSVKQLPDHIRPNAVKEEMTAHAMKNQLGTMFTDGPDGVGIPTFKVPTIKSKTLFNPIVYQPNDFDKPSDLRKAMLEEERNLNASFSKRPFKTSENVKVVEAVPHDFGVDKTKKKRKGALYRFA